MGRNFVESEMVFSKIMSRWKTKLKSIGNELLEVSDGVSKGGLVIHLEKSVLEGFIGRGCLRKLG